MPVCDNTAYPIHLAEKREGGMVIQFVKNIAVVGQTIPLGNLFCRNRECT